MEKKSPMKNYFGDLMTTIPQTFYNWFIANLEDMPGITDFIRQRALVVLKDTLCSTYSSSILWGMKLRPFLVSLQNGGPLERALGLVLIRLVTTTNRIEFLIASGIGAKTQREERPQAYFPANVALSIWGKVQIWLPMVVSDWVESSHTGLHGKQHSDTSGMIQP